jgi:cytochrome c biogenesis protein CcmG, thiol:disulfide interchange protein DsbE
VKSLKFLVPLALFGVLVVFLAIGLSRDPREVPSPLVGKPAPGFTLAQLQRSERTFTPDEMKGKVWLLNVWASWCVSCRVEHPVLNDMNRRGVVAIVGFNWKDKREDGLRWLQQHGDPYQLSVFDGDGRVAIDYGVYGAPETFVIDKLGIIRYKQIGPITPEVLEKTILPLLKSLNA